MHVIGYCYYCSVAQKKTVTENGDKKGKAAQKSQDLNDCFETEALQQTNAPDKDDDQDDTSNDQPTPQKTPTQNSNNSRSKRRSLELKPSEGSSSENPSEHNSNSSAAVTQHRQNPQLKEKFEVEAIMGHQVHRSMVVMYEIKWLGYSEKDNTWEPATSVHEDCLKLCASYWAKHKERPKNAPTVTSIAKEQQQKEPESSKPEDKYLTRLRKNNITDDNLYQPLRNQGFKIAYGTEFPTATTDWAREMRQIHVLQPVVGTDQILAYVSWVNKKKTVHAVQELHEHCPGELFSFYEARLRFAD
ncbi:hypothetical protein BDB00DRAFT_787920 [Zychaea mexicana]|uniref:uncharacterized protein n=1 Tax=Zychaea mexicana TaxID=64656 RepID=UPI0022FEF67E|nr:uncharacterized protein BDB00DRAFT_787920 [Zychaea mexicana]KAI9493415.1 hypothetical protein BDB00DRAFT_787920 [Zychaea mexicana]